MSEPKKKRPASKRSQQEDAYDVQRAIDLGVEVIVMELRKLKEFSSDESSPLDGEYTTQITKYVNTLITVGKDNREQSANMDLTELSDEDLQKLADEALGDSAN
jgi:hypothetical protein